MTRLKYVVALTVVRARGVYLYASVARLFDYIYHLPRMLTLSRIYIRVCGPRRLGALWRAAYNDGSRHTITHRRTRNRKQAATLFAIWTARRTTTRHVIDGTVYRSYYRKVQTTR